MDERRLRVREIAFAVSLSSEQDTKYFALTFEHAKAICKMVPRLLTVDQKLAHTRLQI